MNKRTLNHCDSVINDTTMKKSSRIGDWKLQKHHHHHHRVSSILDIPESLLQEIFFKVSIKDIMRSKCVCMAWRDLFSEPIFTQNYVRYSKIKLVLHSLGISRSNVLNLLEFHENGHFDRTRFELKLPDWVINRSASGILGSSCNGFFCVLLHKQENNSEYEVILLTNPITGHSIQLPGRKLVQLDYYCVARYFFGFDPSTNLFKVLRIIYKETYTDGCIKQEQESAIFTVGVDNHWRNLSVSFPDLQHWTRVTFFDGAFYWIPSVRCPASLSTFDLAQEKLGQLSFPPDFVLDPTSICGELVVLSNQLFMMDNTSQTQKILWKMKKNSITQSWTKIVLFQSWLPAGMTWHYLLPITELPDGEILLNDGQRYLISCNVKQKKCSKIYTCAAKDAGLYDIRPYTPSFSCQSC